MLGCVCVCAKFADEIEGSNNWALDLRVHNLLLRVVDSNVRSKTIATRRLLIKLSFVSF